MTQPVRIPENPTGKIDLAEVVHKRLDQLLQKLESSDVKMDEMRTDICNHLHEMRGDIGLLKGEAETMGKWRGEMETWRSRSSDRAKQPSQHDLDAVAAVAAEKVARETADSSTEERIKRIEAKTDIQTAMLTKAGALTKDPRVIFVLFVAYAMLKSWAAKHGIEAPL